MPPNTTCKNCLRLDKERGMACYDRDAARSVAASYEQLIADREDLLAECGMALLLVDRSFPGEADHTHLLQRIEAALGVTVEEYV